MEHELHVEIPTQHLAKRLAVPGGSAAIEDKVLMDSGSGITAMSEEVEEAAGNDPNRVNAGVCWACSCCDVDGPGV